MCFVVIANTSSENGEDYTMRLVTKRDGKFPLLEKLNRVLTELKTSEWTAYSAADTPDIDREKIAYFAISVLWRASVHSWKQENGKTVSIDLGRRYNEEIRNYLLSATPIPKNASLAVTICTDALNQTTFFNPSENQKVRDGSVGFLARGINFMFRISRTLAPWQRRNSMINNPNGWIFTYDCKKHSTWRLGD
jgi:hypothetical protein